VAAQVAARDIVCRGRRLPRALHRVEGAEVSGDDPIRVRWHSDDTSARKRLQLPHEGGEVLLGVDYDALGTSGSESSRQQWISVRGRCLADALCFAGHALEIVDLPQGERQEPLTKVGSLTPIIVAAVSCRLVDDLHERPFG
jgi:hypothetical protein